jgi:hypothetical protein
MVRGRARIAYRALAAALLPVLLAAACAGPAAQRTVPTEDVRLVGPDYTLTITIAAAYTGFCGPITYVLSNQAARQRETSFWTVTFASASNVTIGEVSLTCPTVLPNGSANCQNIQTLAYRCQQVQINARSYLR